MESISKAALKEFRGMVVAKYGTAAQDLLNKHLLSLAKRRNITSHDLDRIESDIQARVVAQSVSPQSKVLRHSTRSPAVVAANSAELRSKSGARHGRIQSGQIGSPIDIPAQKQQIGSTAVTSLSPNRQSEVSVQPKVRSKLLNTSVRTTQVPSPVRDVTIETSGIVGKDGNNVALPLLQITTPNRDNRLNSTMQSSLYGRGFRTPVKRYVSKWDARCIQDSKDYLKEQQLKGLEAKHQVSSLLTLSRVVLSGRSKVWF